MQATWRPSTVPSPPRSIWPPQDPVNRRDAIDFSVHSEPPRWNGKKCEIEQPNESAWNRQNHDHSSCRAGASRSSQCYDQVNRSTATEKHEAEGPYRRVRLNVRSGVRHTLTDMLDIAGETNPRMHAL